MILNTQFNNHRELKDQETEVLRDQVTTLSVSEKKLREEHKALRQQLNDHETVKDGKAVALQISDIDTIISEEPSADSALANSHKQLESQATEEISKLTKQLADKNAYLEVAYTELDSIKREWRKTYPLNQNSNDNWVTIGRRPGKTKFNCEHQIAEMRQSDPESMYSFPSANFMLTCTQ